MEPTYAVQYQISYSRWERALGLAAALRARSFSGVVMALTSTEDTRPARSVSAWASASGATI